MTTIETVGAAIGYILATSFALMLAYHKGGKEGYRRGRQEAIAEQREFIDRTVAPIITAAVSTGKIDDTLTIPHMTVQDRVKGHRG